MAIVHEKIEKLGGSISIKTKPNIGTSFHIVLPLTLATFRGILVQSAKQIFIMPTIYVERALKLSRQEIKTIEGKQMISLNGRILSLVYLDDVLELAKKEHRNSPFALVLVVKLGEKRIAFSVDKILSEQEILVKNLGKHLLHVRNIAGVTVLGSGDLAPILDIFDLMKSVLKINPNSVTENQLKEEKKSILIVDDSTTSRMFLKKILESAGYLVKTAINGVDALSRLKMENFDLVISDVEMPQMNGFDLATRIRDDKKLVKLPIILITSLTSLKDRKQGINAGANAYIAKNNLKEGNLLKVIQKLL